MFRFFRSIRQNLIAENKTFKYLKYAVGEFLLIVAGILVALQIQTWNENRKLEQDRQELIENLKAEFRKNLELLDEQVSIREVWVDELDKYLAYAAGDSLELSIEDLKSLITNAYTGTPFHVMLGTFEAAISTGSISLLGDPALNQLFSQLKSNQESRVRLSDIAIYDQFAGGNMELWGKLGTLDVIRGNEEDVPDAYKLSDEEFRSFIAQKEVYAVIDAKRTLRSRSLGRIVNMKNICTEILAALEALD